MLVYTFVVHSQNNCGIEMYSIGMNEWANESMNEWMNEWMDGCMEPECKKVSMGERARKPKGERKF